MNLPSPDQDTILKTTLNQTLEPKKGSYENQIDTLQQHDPSVESMEDSQEEEITHEVPPEANQTLGGTATDKNTTPGTNQVASVAQTPCFAETPNTTDQFKGYKIDPKDQNSYRYIIKQSNGMISSNYVIGNSGMGIN